jgi:hypothetical protein
MVTIESVGTGSLSVRVRGSRGDDLGDAAGLDMLLESRFEAGTDGVDSAISNAKRWKSMKERVLVLRVWKQRLGSQRNETS